MTIFKRQKSLLICLMVLLTIFAAPILLAPQQALADSIAELEDRISELEGARATLEGDISALDVQKAEVDDAIAVIDREADAIRAESSPYRQSSDKAAVTLYKMNSSSASVVEMVLNADSLQQAVDLSEYCNDVYQSCAARIAETHDAIAEVESRKTDLVVRQESLSSDIAAKTSQLSDNQAEMDRINSELVGLREEMAKLLENADNSSLARLSASMAYSQKVSNAEGYPATAAYRSAWETIMPGDCIPCGRSCDRGVLIPIRMSGLDVNFPPVCTSQFEYMRSSSEWVDLGVWNGSTGMLAPGDILVSVAGNDGASYTHSCMYVGYDIAQEMYDKFIVGSDGDLGRPGPEAVFSSASYQWGSEYGRALCLCADGESGSHVFRHI